MISQTGWHHSEETRKKISIANKGKKLEKVRIVTKISKGWKHSKESIEKMRRAKIGKTASEETRKKISESLKKHFEPLEMREMLSKSHTGLLRTEVHKKNLSKALKGKYCGASGSNWKGGISFEPYCVLFNNEFKERCRAYFGYICVECGSPQNGTKHTVHHVNYDKMVCCNNTRPLFVCLCKSCNAIANGNKNGHSRDWWQQHFTDMIEGYYGGKCYLSKEEYISLYGVQI